MARSWSRARIAIVTLSAIDPTQLALDRAKRALAQARADPMQVKFIGADCGSVKPPAG